MAIYRTSQANITPGVIDFSYGQPGPDLLPLDLLRRAADLGMSTKDPAFLYYGYEQGDGYFRLALADFLQARYGIPVGVEELFVSAGVSQALDLLCTLFTQPGDVIFVEEPTYHLALRIFADHRLKVVSIPIDREGLLIHELQRALVKHRPVFLYTIPVFQNPSGVTLSTARRKKLLELSQEYEFLIIADEVYHLLNYAITPAPMATFTSSGRVISLGSFSKILAPGLRLGWVQAAPSLMERLNTCGLLDSGGGLNPFTSNVIRYVLEQGWQDVHLDRLKEIYSQRIQSMQAAISRHLGDTVEFSKPQGGYFFWLKGPDGMITQSLLPAAYEYKVGFLPGSMFTSAERLQNYMRLSFSFYAERQLEQGVQRLAKVLVG